MRNKKSTYHPLITTTSNDFTANLKINTEVEQETPIIKKNSLLLIFFIVFHGRKVQFLNCFNFETE